MKKIIILLIITLTIILGYMVQVIVNVGEIKINKISCMTTSNKTIIYECLYHKDLFSLDDYILFLKTNKEVKFFDNEKNIDFLIEEILTDNLCLNTCKNHLNIEIYDNLLLCAKNSKECSSFVINENYKKEICRSKVYSKEMFLNETIYTKYKSLSINSKQTICDFTEDRYSDIANNLDISGDMIRDFLNSKNQSIYAN